jgi:hypothetical protein
MFAAGLTSQRITELLPCWDSGHTDADQRAMLRAERERIQSKIDDLQAALDPLDKVIAITPRTRRRGRPDVSSAI